jgi:membrane fusion protein, hemolysin D
MLPVLRPRRYELEFLPAALEIVESPPSPIGRMVGATLIVVFTIAVVWASFGKIDIVASAPGKIVPSGRSKLVQPFEIGVVRAIHVRDGQTVKSGDVLIELDSTMSQAERNHLNGDLIAAKLDISRLKAALADGDDPGADFRPPQDATPTQAAMQQQYLVSQVGEHRAKLASLDRQKTQRAAERATIAATITKLEATLSVADERVSVRRQLWDQQLGSRLLYLSELQDQVSQQQDLLVQRSRLNESEAALAAIIETRAQTAAEYRRNLLSDLATAEQKAGALQQDLIKAQERLRLQSLIAPIDGIVQQLAVHTVGGVVTPAQELLVVVPTDSQLEIEAMVSNRDIGFVHPGQVAEIKVDTFSFTRYGLIHGKVLSVSTDAITRQKPTDRLETNPSGAEATSSEPKGQELVYAARVSLDRTQMQVDENLVDLSPGMAVTVEIKTGARTLLGYLLSPLLKYRHDSLRER